MKDKQTQPKSFRITEETANKLKEIASSTGKNQQDTLAMLIQVYELQEGKEVLSGKKDDIEKFEGLITSIVRMYMTALEDGKDAMIVAKSQYEAQLASKDALILDLQKRCKELQESNIKYFEREDTYVKELDILKKREEEYGKQENTLRKSYEALLTSKEEILTERTASIDKLQIELQEKVKELEQKEAECELIKSQKEALMLNYKACEEDLELSKGKIKGISVQNEELNKVLAALREQYKKEMEAMEAQVQEKYMLSYEQKLFDTKLQLTASFEERLEKLQTRLDEYREKYYELFDRKQGENIS